MIKQYDYKTLAKYYDILEGSEELFNEVNIFLNKIFKKKKVKTVLDMTCGTGAQAIGLAKKRYNVTASDISKEMLAIAKKKAKRQKLKIKFYHGDIRTSKYGKFDAAFAIFNAIGHLSKKDFEKAIRNVAKNLKEDGIFIFDIFNLDFMKVKGIFSHPFIDKAKKHNETKFVRFNDNSLDSKKGIMHINQKTYIEKGHERIKLYKESWDLQIYTSNELKKLLENNGFIVENFYGNLGNRFIKNKSQSIMTVARKRG